MNLTDKKKGIYLSLIGILFITPDSLFVRLINLPSWELVFYRGFVPAICLAITLLIFYKKKIIKAFIITGSAGLIYAILIALGNATFVLSLQNTNVANTLIMLALTPLATALLSSIILKEHPNKKMWITIVSCFLVVLFIFYDSYQGSRILGDFFGLATAFFVGGSAVAIRYGKINNFLPMLFLAKIFTMLIGIIFIQSFQSIFFIDYSDIYFILAMGIFTVFIPLSLLTLAPRYIPAYEVQIFFVLETIIGPLWVWFVISEQPTIKTIIGGVVIILIIAFHTITEIRNEKQNK